MAKNKPKYYWKSQVNTVNEARKAMEKEKWDTLPGPNSLLDRGYSRLRSAILRYHGGFPKFRRALGEERKKEQLPSGTWSLDFTLEEARRIMRKEGWKKLPNHRILDNKGYYGLSNSIAKNHDGFTKFRKLLGQKELQKPKGYWKNVKNIVFEVRKVMQELEVEELPNSDLLIEEGYSGLANAIRNSGGYVAFRELLGQKQKQERTGILKNLENVVAEVRKVMKKEEWENLPSLNSLRNSGYPKLATAIQKYHGPMRKFREIFREVNGDKTEAQKLERLLRDYISETGDTQ